MLSQLTIYCFDNFLHFSLPVRNTLYLERTTSLCNISRDTETIHDQLIKDVNKSVATSTSKPNPLHMKIKISQTEF